MESLITNPKILAFIEEHLNSNVSQLALRFKEVDGVPIQVIVRQIQGKQKAKGKLPSWFQKEGIIFPPTLNLEQSSSEKTAHYKSTIAQGKRLVDLTGGFGVDVVFFSKSFEDVVYVERNQELASIVKHNLKVLGIENVTTHIGDSIKYLADSPDVDFFYLDPARRDNANKKIFKIEECEPNVIELLPLLLAKSERVLVKTSPLLDLKAGLNELRNVSQIHVLAVDNECKEVLFLLTREGTSNPEIKTVNITSQISQFFSFDFDLEHHSIASYSHPLKYLYEPNAAILKAGAFNSISSKFNLFKLHKSSHLYTSEALIPDFPGRKFEVESVEKYDKNSVQKSVKTFKANITTRNFPDSVDQIRKKLGLKEGGEKYLFATTDLNNKPVILITNKVD